MLEGNGIDDGSAEAFDAYYDAEGDYEATADTQAGSLSDQWRKGAIWLALCLKKLMC